MNRVLMIAYHFPPLAGSSGIQRTLRFCRYLRDFDWHPVVLTTHPRAYELCSDDQLGDIPEGTTVIRAPAWDARRHFSVKGRYAAFTARPDRWSSWWPGGVIAGLHALRRHKIAAIWSTYPIASAHLIGHSLAHWTGLPWVADFRDPMTQDGYPPDKAVWNHYRRIEAKTIARASASIFATDSAVALHQARYPHFASRLQKIENGYDNEAFADLPTSPPLNTKKYTILHSGIVYPKERNPEQLFSALAILKRTDPGVYNHLTIRFRAAVHESLLETLATKYNVLESVEISPPISYRDALSEMMRADALLILQARDCNAQIPAKFYEYLAAGRPILTLTCPHGDTAAACSQAGLGAIAPLDDADGIATLLRHFCISPSRGTMPNSAFVAAASRRNRTRLLASVLNAAIAPH